MPSPPPHPSSGHNSRKKISVSDLGTSEAEGHLVSTLEARRQRSNAGGGERPPLGGKVDRLTELLSRGENDDNDINNNEDDEGPRSSGGASRFKGLARKVMLQRKEGTLGSSGVPVIGRHRSKPSNAQMILESLSDVANAAMQQNKLQSSERTSGTIQHDNQQQQNNKQQNNKQQKQEEKYHDNGFFHGVGAAEEKGRVGESAFAIESTAVDRLVTGAMQVEKILDTPDDTSISSTTSTLTKINYSDEQLPLVNVTNSNNNNNSMYESTVQENIRKKRSKKRIQRTIMEKLIRKINKILNPKNIIHSLKRMIQSAYYTMIAIPCCILALLCYYYLENPKFDFMPGKATLSYWLNFIGRQLLLLDLSRLTQYILIDNLLLGSKYTIKLFGPIITLWALQSKGYPFIIIFWGIWDLLLLHGDNQFQTHWLYWTGISMYSRANSGSYILSSPMYLRVLLSLILTGSLTSFKRAFVAIYFGRRTFAEFKPRLEKILKDIVLLNEVSDLAEEANRLSTQEDTDMFSDVFKSEDVPRDRRGLMDKELQRMANGVTWEESAAEKDLRNDDFQRTSSTGSQTLSRSSSGSIRMKQLLDRWEEPVNKFEKNVDASIDDILRFRRALSFMDEPSPFGETFGPASTRDECIESAHAVYERLLKLTPDVGVLSNDILEVLAQEEDGDINRDKRSALRRLFRPDRFNQIPLLAFVQSCDTLYRKLRYFRASVGNASVIDKVLEQMIDVAFWFAMFLTILTILDFNPWPLLVSMSTLFVSFSFAMGSSASKYIEGVLLIAVRRPYDLGDRIVFTSSGTVENPGPSKSWFVEDINLFSTTLRFALTNEVASVNNGNIADTRICNLTRSPNALCNLDIILHICLVEEEKAGIFKEAIENYVRDNPRVWEALSVFRFNEFDADNEQVSVRITVRHRNSWQDAPRVLRDYGDFQMFVWKLSIHMRVNFDSPPSRRLLYEGGTIKTGGVRDYKRNLLLPSNIVNNVNTSDDSDPVTDKQVTDALFRAQLQKENEAQA